MNRLNGLKVYGLILLFISILLTPLLPGVGQNWDWTFPLFTEQTNYYLTRHLTAWNSVDLGFPLSYSPHLYASVLVVLFGSLPITPEASQWTMIVLVLSSIAYLSTLIVGRYSKSLALLAGIAITVNSAVFYKLLAGHIYYLIGFTVFLGLIYYLLQHYKPSLNSALVVGMLWAISGVQIQFLVFSFLVLVVYFSVYREKFRFRDLAIMVFIVLLLHLYWLVLFITSATDFQSVSITAKADAFGGLIRSSWKGVLGLAFSPATFIRNFYPTITLAFFSILWIMATVRVLRGDNDRSKYFFSVLLLLFVVIALGTFHSLPIPILAKLFPMLREVGHAAPIVVALLIILASSSRKGQQLHRTVAVYLVLFIAVSAPVYYKYIPRVDFGGARHDFQQFHNFSKEDTTTYRVLTYPFFNQYSYRNNPTLYRGNTPMSNSGWDSFIIFSGKEYIENGVSPRLFTESLQRQFLRSLDVKILAEKNIRYIYDLSNIYESAYDRFVAPEVYENNLALIKNDPNFSQKIIDKNPGEVRLVAPNILEIINFSPRISGDGVSFKKINETRYEIRIDSDQPTTSLRFLSSFHPSWKIYESDGSRFKCDAYSGNECVTDKKLLFTGEELGFFRKQPVAEESHEALTPVGNSWTITSNGNSQPRFITLYYQPQSWFVLGLIASSLTLLGTLAYLLIISKRLSKSSAQVVVGPEGDTSK